MPRELREMMAAAPTAALAPPPSSHSSSRLTIDDTKVIILLAAWFFLRQLQRILGPKRRRSRSWLVQHGAMAAYYLPTPLLFYTAGTVYSSTSHNKVLLGSLCSYFLVLNADGPIVMRAYTLTDGPLQRWRLAPWLLYFAWLQFVSVKVKGPKYTPADLLYLSLVFVLPGLTALLIKPPVAKLDFETKGFADYMVWKKSTSGSLFVRGLDDNSLQKGCEYPFMFRDHTWVTIKDLPRQHQDTCLSYSFCMLLARRYFKLGCFEEGDAEVRNLVLTELLSDYKSAFVLVEVQLAFLHDQFFTDYPTDQDSTHLQLFVKTVLYISPIVLGVLMFRVHSFKVVVLIALVAFLAHALLEYLKDLRIRPNYWHLVRQIFKYYPTATGRVDSPASRWHSKGSGQYYWRNKIGQYSLLADYDRRSLKKKMM